MAIPHSMTNDERRPALLRARKDVEISMYTLALSVGLDADSMDYAQPDVLWQTETEGVSQIDHLSDELKRPYVDLLNSCFVLLGSWGNSTEYFPPISLGIVDNVVSVYFLIVV